MLVLKCNKCNSVDIEPIKLHCWNSVEGTVSGIRNYCNTCCSILPENNNQYINIENTKLVSN